MRLDKSFFKRDVLKVAPDLLGKILVRKFSDGREERFIIAETEAYRGEEDEACHANKGRTARTEIMYHEGGAVYVYLIYGMYWLLNIVTGDSDNPQAVLIRGLEEVSGPGRVGRVLQLDKSFYGDNVCQSPKLWIEDGAGQIYDIVATERIGVDYASDGWRLKPWRFIADIK